jgi:bacterioferritin (cytochrome b1)
MKEVVNQEMTHAVNAANLIIALGGTPDVTSPDKIFKFPG